MQAALRVIDYLQGTQYLALELGGTDDGAAQFECSSDAVFTDNSNRKSTKGKLIKLLKSLIDWQAMKQLTVSTLIIEAELLALSHLVAWLLWWMRFFSNITLELDD